MGTNKYSRIAASSLTLLALAAGAILCAGIVPACAEVGDSYVKRGNEFYHESQWDKAIDQYLLAVKINPDSIRAWQNLGLAYQSKKDFKKAIATFEKIHGLYPEFTPAYISEGLLHAQLGSYAKAEKQYAKALRLEPDNLIGYLNMAAVLAKQKKYKQALRVVRGGLDREPSNPYLHLLAANVFLLNDKFALARREYLKVLKFQPQTPGARLALAKCMGHLDQYDQALQQVRLVQEFDAAYPALAKANAEVHALRYWKEGKDWDQAVELYRLAATQGRDDKEIWRKLGDLLAAKGKYDEARKWYRRILDDRNTSVKERNALEKNIQSWPGTPPKAAAAKTAIQPKTTAKPKTKQKATSHANVSSKL